MKKIILIIIILIICGCSSNNKNIISKIELDNNNCKIISEIDNHSGFHGDGEYFAKIKCSNINKEELSRHWKKLPLSNSITSIVKNMNKYLNIFEKDKDKILENQHVDNYLNKELNTVTQETKNIKKLVLGTGNKVIAQYPEKDSNLDANETLILLTNSKEYKLPSLKNYSKKEVTEVCKMLNIDCTFKGYGYVKNQSKENSIIKKNEKITFNLG